jgi:hypothetical protein
MICPKQAFELMMHQGFKPELTGTASLLKPSVRICALGFRLHSAISRAASQVARRVEAAGIEPASADAPDRASTSVVWAFVSPGGRFPDDLPTG